MSVHHLIVTYGYAAVFVLVAIDSSVLPVPGETILVAAAGYAGTTHHLDPWLICALGFVAACVGASAGFWLGEAGGYRLVCRYGRYVRLDEAKIKLTRYVFDRRGGWIVFVCRFVTIVRTYVSFAAGTSRMSYARFALFTVPAAAVWAAGYTFLAYYAGSWLTRSTSWLEWLLVGVVVAVAGTTAVVVHRRLKDLEARAEAAYPGPLLEPRKERRGGGDQPGTVGEGTAGGRVAPPGDGQAGRGAD